MTQKKDWRNYSKVAFTSMEPLVSLWKTGCPDTVRAITKIYYELVFSSGNNTTGLVSEEAFQNHISGKKTDNDDDHILSPQFVARMIMDEADYYFSNYEAFEKVFNLCRQTIKVTSKENHELRQLTTNDRSVYQIKIPTVGKYHYLGINLMLKKGRKIDTCVFISKDQSDKIIDIPECLTKYESQFVVGV